ncbi:hypothetical protein DMB66_20350 [Actinoplanes sp. ATCC 53533]|nr:hypothetical protein DMB66_20350 [Actinoplanes sp. ATCC 53533]
MPSRTLTESSSRFVTTRSVRPSALRSAPMTARGLLPVSAEVAAAPKVTPFGHREAVAAAVGVVTVWATPSQPLSRRQAASSPRW